jgi:hypothetical protein
MPKGKKKAKSPADDEVVTCKPQEKTARKSKLQDDTVETIKNVPNDSHIPPEVDESDEIPTDIEKEPEETGTTSNDTTEPPTATVPKISEEIDQKIVKDETIKQETSQKGPSWAGSDRAKQIICECGLEITAGNKKTHEKNKYHIAWQKKKAEYEQQIKEIQAKADQKVKEEKAQANQRVKQLEEELKELRTKDLKKERLATIKKLKRQAVQLQKSVSELSVD